MPIRPALDYGELPIRQAAVQKAIEGARKTLRRPMGKEDWDLVKRLAGNGELPKDAASEERTRQLMVNRQILQYSNGTEWFAPNPLLGDPPELGRSQGVVEGTLGLPSHSSSISRHCISDVPS